MRMPIATAWPVASRVAVAMLLASAAGCGAVSSVADGGDAGEAIDAASLEASVACAPALSIDPATVDVNPFGLATLLGKGGTGAYRFTLSDNKSGAIVNLRSGAYLAGPTAGVTDVVQLTDDNCAGMSQAAIQVVSHLDVRPSNAVLPPGTSFRFDVHGGSGSFRFTLTQNGSGGSLDAGGNYVAGQKAAIDVVLVADTKTGETATAQLKIDPMAPALSPEPAFVALPVGETFHLTVSGGSGWLDAAATGNSATYKDGVLTGASVGATIFDLTDTFTRQKTRVHVEVAASSQMVAKRAGDRFSSGFIATLMPGGAWKALDIDGDGLADAVYADPEANVSGFNSGAVYIYKGARGGPAAAPSRVIAGEHREDEFGRGVAVADFDGDGKVDLAVGAPLANAGQPQIGAVYLYKGMGGALFSDQPTQVISGLRAYDYFGWSLAVGDFNGDGRLDLAVGAPLCEDRMAMPVTNDQGAVEIFLGYPDGFLARPDAIVYGQVTDVNGAWKGSPGLWFGYSVGAGDIDGDGKADLAASAINFNSTLSLPKYDPSRGSDGAVYVYAGAAASGMSPGGVRPTPSRFLAGSEPTPGVNEFGRHLVVADLDGDKHADLIVGEGWASPGMKTYAGAVRIFAGGALPVNPPSAYTAADKAEVSYLGTDAYTYFGFHVGIGDADGDGLTDLLVGHWIDGAKAPNAGSVKMFKGVKGGFPAPTVTRVFVDDQPGDRMGQALGLVGDMDGDGRNDLIGLAGFATVGDALEVGAPSFFSGDPMAMRSPLDAPGQASGAYFGQSTALLDFNNDGFTDLVVGAPRGDVLYPGPPPYGIDAGVVQVYLGTANGIPAQPSLTLKQFYGHNDGDWLGWRVAPAGDFDGDGLQDLAVLARNATSPANYMDVHYANPGNCMTTQRYAAGAMYVFRGSRGGTPASDPAFLYHGPQARRLDTLDGGFDFNGDKKGDVVVGGYGLNGTLGNQEGGVILIGGRPATPGKITVICDPALVSYGIESVGYLGYAVAGVRDIDGDGCDEVAAGAFEEHLSGNDNVAYQGTTRVIFGFGPGRCAPSPRFVLLRSGETYAFGGASLAAADLDGDHIPELAIGGWNHTSPAGAVGGAWVLPGTYLRSLAGSATPIPGSGDLPRAGAAPFVPMGATGHFLVEGRVTGEQFGQSVALLPDLGNGKPGLAVGAPLGDLSGVPQSGGVRIFAWLSGKDGLNPTAVGALGGETSRTGGHFGDTLFAGKVGGAPAIAVGAYYSSAVSLDFGSAFVVPIRVQ